MLGFVSVLTGQERVDPSGYRLKHWSTEDGLPQNSVNTILRTSDGYLWVGTYGGVAKFDGIEFEKLQFPELKYARIVSLLEDRDSSMWLGTENNGLYHLKNNKLHHYSTHNGLPGKGVVDLLQVSPHSIIAIIQGQGPVEIINNKVRFYPYPELREELIDQVILDQNKNLWITSSTGVYRLRELGSDLEFVANSKSSEDGRAIILDDQGLVYHANQSGLYQIDTVKMSSQFLWKTDYNLLSRQFVSHGKDFFFGGGTDHFFKKNGKQIIQWTSQFGLPPGEISSIYPGDNKEIWIGLNGGGLVRLAPNPISNMDTKDGLKDELILAIHQDYQNNLWIGTNSGEFYWKEPNKHVVPYTYQVKMSSSDVWSIASDTIGNIWVGSFGDGIATCNRNNDIGFKPVENWGGESSIVLALLYDTTGDRLLAGTDRGGVFQLKNGEWTTLIKESITQARVTQFVISPDRLLYVATQGNGYKIINTNGTVIHKSIFNHLSEVSIRDIYFDQQGRTWIGTYGDGLILEMEEKFFVINTSNGLFDNLISTINEDSQGFLWMSCNQGVFKTRKQSLIDFAEGKLEKISCQVFNKSHGMGNSETNGGFQPASVMLNKHTILYPTIKGIATFNTEELINGPVLKNVIINQVAFGDSLVYPKAKISIPKEFRDIRFSYKAPSFFAPELITYEYQLEGFDTEWKSSGFNRFASYTRLAPGKYIFKVRAKNSEGVYSSVIQTLPIYFTPYFYEVLGFQVFMGLGLITFIIFLFWNTQRRAKLREIDLLNQVDFRTKDLQREKELTEEALNTVAEQGQELERINKSRSHFFANVSHELKTPLTLIKGPVSAILEKKKNTLDPQTIRDLKLVEQNSEQLNQLIVQLLDIAQSENGNIEVKNGLVNPSSLINNIVNQHKNWIEQKRIKIHIRSLSRDEIGRSDKKILEKIISNLLSNALKFTPEEGAVFISYQVKNEIFILDILDTGKGVDQEDSPYVFDRFYKSSNKYQSNLTGSGIGLAVVKEFSELLGGTVHLISPPGKGAKFTISIPFPAPVDIGTPQTLDAPIAGKNSVNGFLKTSNDCVYDSNKKEEQPLVLIVEDHQDIRSFIRGILADDYNVLEAENGVEGLLLAKQHLPDLIVSDIMMPIMDGMEMLKKLRLEKLTHFIPLVLLTAKGTEQTRIEGWKEGADAYLAKPFNSTELAIRIKTILENRGQLKQQILQSIAAGTSIPKDNRLPFEIQFEETVAHNLCNPDYSFNESLDDFAMSLSKFQRLVKEHYQITPQVYLRLKRLELAKSQIEQNSGSISEIAYSCGFNSISYFNRVFKAQFDASPTEMVLENKTTLG